VNVRFLREARAELDEAAHHYESARQDLGDEFEFYAEIDVALAFIVDFPNVCPPSSHGTRRKKVRRFPYFLIYAVEGGEIVIAAVPYAGRDPAYWHKRLL
jgi:plasmid stabilization system protein ParE